LHTNVQALLAQAGSALATPVEHAFPHVLQWFGSVVVSTHVLSHWVGAARGQLVAQA
jgi:hypothetical protein